MGVATPQKVWVGWHRTKKQQKQLGLFVGRASKPRYLEQYLQHVLQSSTAKHASELVEAREAFLVESKQKAAEREANERRAQES